MLHCFLCILIFCCLACGDLEAASPSDLYSPFEKVNDFLNQLQINPFHIAANIELGLLYAEQSEHTLAKKHLNLAIISGNWSNITALTNYALQLSLLGEHAAAVSFLHLSLQLYHPGDPSIFFMLGLLHLKQGDLTACHSFYRNALSIKQLPELYILVITSFNDHKFFSEANDYITQAVQRYPGNSGVLFVCGLNFHFQSRYDLALELYQLSGNLNPSHEVIYMNIAGIYQMLGNLKKSKTFYEHVYTTSDRARKDSGFLNNFGSLLLAMNEYEEGVLLLQLSIAANPEQEHAPVNLAGYYQDEGLLQQAEELLLGAARVSDNSPQIELRIATLLSPVMTSWPEALQERREMVRKVTMLSSNPPPADQFFRPLMSGLDRIHFYIQYHGLNDRKIQEAIAQNYRKVIRNVDVIAPRLMLGAPAVSGSGRATEERERRTSLEEASQTLERNINPLIRVGFMSKLFGVFEPHGLLLDGVLKHLPRDHFRVLALEIAAGGGQKLVSPLITENADETVQISLDHVHAAQTLFDLRLDVLVFADVLSEPMNHFLLHSRFAPIQIAFWGNPITSGSHHVDYFLSADFLEHPYRSRIPVDQEPYSEQVVLTPGQGIWYYHPQSYEMKKCEELVSRQIPVDDHSFTRSDFSLDSDWFVFLCPQSVFKLHPLFDLVVAAILRASPQSHVVFTSGRRPRWTSALLHRLERSIDPRDVTRCHIIERVSSEKFIDFIQIADALLHPFPFDGSRTSADSIAANIPYVTLPTEYLRGRMGASFMRTMNIPELVAKNATDYVDIAIQLSSDASFLHAMKSALRQRSWLIWEDMQVPFEWGNFLSAATGAPHVHDSFEDFLRESCPDRNVTHELYASGLRESNQKMFDTQWGPPEWLLDGGVARLEDDVVGNTTMPRIFRDWM